MKAEDFKENMEVILLPGFCKYNIGKRLNTSTVTSIGGKNTEPFLYWDSFKTVLEACQKYPEYFKIVDPIINNYSIY